jgi:hypothetical protein
MGSWDSIVGGGTGPQAAELRNHLISGRGKAISGSLKYPDWLRDSANLLLNE